MTPWYLDLFRITPIEIARSVRHKKKYEMKRINKRLVSNGLRPKYRVF